MPPKRITKNKITQPKALQSTDKPNSNESTEAELKFDQEVLWSISQFEKLISSGKLSDTKKQESIKAINTLRKPNIPKIQKIQLMRQYFKDIKTKMQQDEENQKSLSFLEVESDPNKGVYLKKKSNATPDEPTNVFRFNFNDPSEDLVDVTVKVNALELKN